jgi:hypothetical protein
MTKYLPQIVILVGALLSACGGFWAYINQSLQRAASEAQLKEKTEENARLFRKLNDFVMGGKIVCVNIKADLFDPNQLVVTAYTFMDLPVRDVTVTIYPMPPNGRWINFNDPIFPRFKPQIFHANTVFHEILELGKIECPPFEDGARYRVEISSLGGVYWQDIIVLKGERNWAGTWKSFGWLFEGGGNSLRVITCFGFEDITQAHAEAWWETHCSGERFPYWPRLLRTGDSIQWPLLPGQLANEGVDLQKPGQNSPATKKPQPSPK